MRLPADATLIVAGDAREGAAGEKVAALIAAWRAEGLPVVHIGRNVEATAPGEAAIAAFDRAALHDRLDAIGTTAAVFCGDGQGLFAAALAAADLGCHVFVTGDACSPDALTPILAVEAFSRGDRARLVDAAAALAAAPTAKARQRREAARQR
jgi:nicotinamidase-related amidase